MPEDYEKDDWTPGHLGDPARERRSEPARRGQFVPTEEELAAYEERQANLAARAIAARKAAARKPKPKKKAEPEPEPEPEPEAEAEPTDGE